VRVWKKALDFRVEQVPHACRMRSESSSSSRIIDSDANVCACVSVIPGTRECT
jgi:hypothetical protein